MKIPDDLHDEHNEYRPGDDGPWLTRTVIRGVLTGIGLFVLLAGAVFYFANDPTWHQCQQSITAIANPQTCGSVDTGHDIALALIVIGLIIAAAAIFGMRDRQPR